MYRLLSTLAALTVCAGALCGEPQPRLLRAEYFGSDAVVVARLTAIRHIDFKHAQDGFLYTLVVTRRIRGAIATKFTIFEENSSARAGFVWVKGREYLLFLRNSNYPGFESSLGVDGCGHSGPVSLASGAFREIALIKRSPHQGGLLQGEISSLKNSDVSQVKVTIHGRDNTYTVFSDVRGAFQIKVPAGCYSVRAAKPGRNLVQHAWSYGDFDKACIENGGAYQVAFEDKP